ncbi:di-trans,poly-cis-decaprenylcistransferase [Candidatus Dependentiae bacterium]|nr:di-trans,poly-cis-decaprenylcistransferase [Candidatus Dependentiae bacterium]
MRYWLIVILGFFSIVALHQFITYEPVQAPKTVQHTSVRHLGVIMDGNRRWAEKNNLTHAIAYGRGIEVLQTTIDYCLTNGITMLSAYAFSLENFKRSPHEIQAVFQQFAQEAHTAFPSLAQRKISVHFIGDRELFPPELSTTIKTLEEQTAQGSALRLNILFCYGGRQEIVNAVKTIVKEIRDKKTTEIPTEETFKNYLWTKNIPDPDLVIRTGGIKRLSNFMPYQTTYSELYFTDHLWPDLTTQDLDAALADYEHRKRTTFGK